ncbi:MAG: hypothetical protein EYC62_04760 [Alphaproteobacteria bacterium]|nr:MAG: hypothetical protein EYC62_04760 [Alphaproteobacteria bacterium]
MFLSMQAKQELSELAALSGGVTTVSVVFADLFVNFVLKPDPGNQLLADHSPLLVAVVPALAAAVGIRYLLRTCR